MPEEYKIGSEFVGEWNRIRAKVDGFNGAGISNSPNTLTHSPPDAPGPNSKQHSPFTALKIIGGISGGACRYTANPFYGNRNNSPSNLQASDLGQTGTNTVEVWNVAEITGGGSLQPNALVFGFLYGFNKNTGMPVYSALAVGTKSVGYVVSNTGSAVYQGNLQTGFATDTSGTGVSHDSTNIIIVNQLEVQAPASSPYLINAAYVPITFMGVDEESGFPIYWNWTQYGEGCSD